MYAEVTELYESLLLKQLPELINRLDNCKVLDDNKQNKII